MLSPPQPFRVDRRFGLMMVGFWLVFTLAALPVTALGMWVKTGTFDLINQVIWESGWAGWAPLSLLVAALCRRYPLERSQLVASYLRLALIGVAIVALQSTLERIVNTTLGVALRDYRWDWKRLMYIVTYKAHAYYAVYWMIVGAVHAWDYHRRFRESELVASQLAAQLASAELARLKTQLQPHFLFNAHHTIIALILKKENEAAARMLTRLSDLLRISISRSGQQLVTVREELETLRLYLEIQAERFRDRLTVDVAADPELLEAEIPHLLFQPLVENALHHGLKDVISHGRLEIRIARVGESLVGTVTDNGAGLAEPDGVQLKNKSHSGIGLTNTRERLQQLYGSAQALEIANRPLGGCEVQVRWPMRMKAAPRAALAR